MVAAMATVTGRIPGMADTARIAREAMQEWLSEFDGYRGLLVFTDESGGRAQLITLWENAEAERRARPGRTAMRDRIAATTGMVVEGMEVYDVPVCEVLAADGD